MTRTPYQIRIKYMKLFLEKGQSMRQVKQHTIIMIKALTPKNKRPR